MHIKLFLLAILSIISVPIIILAATDDFVADSDITIANVTFGAGTADMLILNGSTAASFVFNSGAFTVTDPGSAFKVGSSDSTVKSIQITQSGSTLVCSENTTPGTSSATLPTASGTYTVEPSTTTLCTSLCSAVSNSASFNSFPTCGAASCNAGYVLSGSGSSATCVPIGGGGVLGSVTILKAPTFPQVGDTTTQTLGAAVGLSVKQAQAILDLLKAFEAEQSVIDSVRDVFLGKATTGTPSSTGISGIFTERMNKGVSSPDVKRLQKLLNTDQDTQVALSGDGAPLNETNYFGSLTEKAVQKFQTKYGIVSSGTPSSTGYGLVGPKTIEKLEEVFGK